MKSFGDLIYAPEKNESEVTNKVKSHTPRIDAPDSVKAGKLFEIKVTLGPHPNTAEHSIRRVDVYFYEEERPFNPILLATVMLTPAFAEPNVQLTLKLRKSGTLFAIGYCNLHGLWEARKEIRVT